jgi:hypothetical protein
VGQPFNPYAPQQAQYQQPYAAPPPGWGAPAYHVVGQNLVAMSGAVLPEVCVKCGAQANLVRKRRKFQWVPPWTYVLLVVSLLIGAIVMMIVQKRGTLDLPLCTGCKTRWTHATLAMAGAVLGIFLVLPFVAVVAAVLPDDVAPLVAIVLMLGWLVGVVIVSRVFVRARTVWTTRIDKSGYITVAGVHPQALALLASTAQPAPQYP